MIATLLRLGWLTLRRDRVALGLTFALPLAFFSLFAVVFGGMSGGGTRKIPVAIADDDDSPMSARVVEALANEPGLKVTTQVAEDDPTPLDAASAEALVRAGEVSAAVVLPEGVGASMGDTQAPAIVVLFDAADPIASNLVGGLLQKHLYTSMPDLLIEQGMKQLEQFGGPLTPDQRRVMDRFLPELRAQSSAGDGGGGASGGLFAVEQRSVITGDSGEAKSATIAFYAAGTGVMFLLFSVVGSAGALLDEQDSGTLERLLGSKGGMTGLLVGKWLWATLIGLAQVTVMFLWGAFAFGLDLFGHLLGFVVMTVFTSAAAASFGLVLATACRSRAQLSGISTITILLMSAVGGSMFPRFLMPETMQQLGLLTFNAWALDGYQKVFWYETGVASLWPQVLVLTAIAAGLFAVARRLARRWDVA